LAGALAEAAVRGRLAQERAQLGLERAEPLAEEVRRGRREREDGRDHLVRRPLEDPTAPDVEEPLVAEAGGADDLVLAGRGAAGEGAAAGATHGPEVALDELRDLVARRPRVRQRVVAGNAPVRRGVDVAERSAGL